jgi:hypothetical protein
MRPSWRQDSGSDFERVGLPNVGWMVAGGQEAQAMLDVPRLYGLRTRLMSRNRLPVCHFAGNSQELPDVFQSSLSI